MGFRRSLVRVQLPRPEPQIVNEKFLMPDEPKIDGRSIIFERRKFVRIDESFVVYYTTVAPDEPKSDVSQTKNISIGGILFITDRKFFQGTVLKLRIKLPDVPDYVNVRVKVVDSKERLKNIIYETRAQFIGISEEDKDSINKMVEYHLKKEKES